MFTFNKYSVLPRQSCSDDVLLIELAINQLIYHYLLS